MTPGFLPFALWAALRAFWFTPGKPVEPQASLQVRAFLNPFQNRLKKNSPFWKGWRRARDSNPR